MNRIKIWLMAAVIAVTACGCRAESETPQVVNETTTAATADSLVRNNQVALISSYSEDAVEPFTSYTYDFSVNGNNYMITVTPDEIGTGLTLTAEDNTFGFSTFSVTPPEGYMVVLPYSQQYASQVCEVIKCNSESTPAILESEGVPDLLKIDFYLTNFEDETLPYTVSKLYSLIDNQLVEATVYDDANESYGADTAEEDTVDGIMTALVEETAHEVEVNDYYSQPVLGYIPDSDLIQVEPLKFMAAPQVSMDEEGRLHADIITYRLNPEDMTICRAYETTDLSNALYFGYSCHAVATSVYQYFTASCLNVSDYENYVEIPVQGQDISDYFFKVDDPRFSTVEELREYVSGYFSEDIVDRMFREAPQKYRDIDGELYTILGDSGADASMENLIITDWGVEENVITFHTMQEKHDENGALTGYVNGGDFTVRITEDGFVAEEYSYPYLQ